MSGSQCGCLEVTIIPTYDTDVLGYWVAENEDLLAELKIDLAPSASRCTINLQVSLTLPCHIGGKNLEHLSCWQHLARPICPDTPE